MRKQEFLASGTWTAPAGLKNGECWVTACAGGGGGGGTKLTTSPTPGSAGGGGGGDSVYRKRLEVTPSTGYTITIGAGGAAGVSASPGYEYLLTAGGTGGTTSFGALLSLTGGAGAYFTQSEAGGGGGNPGGPGGTRGQTGGYHGLNFDDGPDAAYGGISYPPGYGTGGRGAFWGSGTGGQDATAGNQGYMLIEWNE